MRVLYLTRKYPPSVGGMQNYHFDLVLELQKSTAIQLIALGLSQFHLLWFLPSAFLRGVGKECDVIHAGDSLMASLGWLLSKIKQKPFTVTVFGLDITYPNVLYQAFFVPAIGKAERIICISENTKRLCIEHGIDGRRCVVIPCGIPVTSAESEGRNLAREEVVRKYGIDPESVILLSVGRLVKRKGIAWFLRNVHPSLRKTAVIIAGDGPERSAIRRETAAPERVRILGRVDDHILRSLYRGCDAFIMPNIKVAGDVEGFGIVLLEAGRHGLYSFASDIDGIPEVIKEGANGTLLESGKADQWIAALAAFEGDRDLLCQKGMRAREYVMSRHSEESVVQGYLEIWEELISGKDRFRPSGWFGHPPRCEE